MPEQNLHYNNIAGKRVIRVEALSDGVFAVALTLLVLDIKVPATELIHSEKDLLAALCTLGPKFLTYLMSFMTIGIFWMGHSVQFTFIEKGDRNLNWISLFFLLFVSMLPFSTALLSEHIDYRSAIGVYWFNIFMLGAVLYLHWRYAYRKGLLRLPEGQAHTIDCAVRRRIITAQSLYLAAALLCFISNYASISLFILVQLNYALGIFSGRKQ